METQIINSDTGATQVLGVSGGTQLVGGSTTETGANFTGGLLQLHEKVSDWEITGKLGAVSGEADIYLAEKDGQKGVVKYYRSVAKPKTEILDRIKGLNHPDIVNTYEYGMYNSHFYEVMEYAEGGSMDNRPRNPDGVSFLPMPEEEVEKICKEVLNAFKTCHEKGIIHRDIKPANIYFRKPGSDAVIADFGISSIMDEAEKLHKTRTGSRTTGYAAPEVLSGIISPKMDYYALGITLWELLTGKNPFTLDNGKRRNDAHLIRDTIEGRIADDILSKEKVSPKMEHLIRGLLVIDPDYRWGYNEVTRHLAGENIEVYKKAKKAWTYPIGNTEYGSLEGLGAALLENHDDAKKKIFNGRLAEFLEDYYPDIAKQIFQISEETSAAGDEDNGILKVAFLLNPTLPLTINNGFKIQNLDDAIAMLENAPESIVQMLRDRKSSLYTWLDITGCGDIAEDIRALPGVFPPSGISDTELAGKAAVLFKHKVIKPFKLAKYADFELTSLDQLENVPKDMQARIINLVREKSYEGLFLPWLVLLLVKSNINEINTGSWKEFLESVAM